MASIARSIVFRTPSITSCRSRPSVCSRRYRKVRGRMAFSPRPTPCSTGSKCSRIPSLKVCDSAARFRNGQGVRRDVGLEDGVLAGDRQALFDGLADVAKHAGELLRVERARVPEVDRAVGLEKRDERETARPVLHVGGVMDVRVDEDVDEVLVEVGVDLLAAEGALGELVAPVAPLGREQQKERPFSPIPLDHVVGVVMEVHPGIVVLVCKDRNRRGQPQDGACEQQRADAGTGRRMGHRYRRARSARTFPRSASLPSPPPIRSTSAPSPSSSRMVSGWEIV